MTYGFRNMIDMVMLKCSDLTVLLPLPWAWQPFCPLQAIRYPI